MNLGFYISLGKHKMTQGILLQPETLQQQTVSVNNVRAVFTQLSEKAYDVLLEVSSHKFFIRIEKDADQIENFEILASK